MKVEHLAEGVDLYLGDCRKILPTLDKVDAVVTDPPYGIGKDGQKESSGKHGGRKAYDFLGWDSERPTPEVFQLLLAAGHQHVIWGGNYFADLFPPTGKWLVWDKGQRINQSDGELAWTSAQGALRILELNRVFLMKDGAEHPTQKPIEIMRWSILQLGKTETVLDPFMGSGTTGVAAVQLGRKFIGVEIEPKYFDIACRRISEALKQGDLFVEKPKPAKQEALDFDPVDDFWKSEAACREAIRERVAAGGKPWVPKGEGTNVQADTRRDQGSSGLRSIDRNS